MNEDIQTDIYERLHLQYDADNVYYQVLESVLDAADLIDMSDRLKLMMSQPKNEIMVHFPVKQDDGTWKLYKGYRVQHNNILGPYKGGIRFHESVHLDDIKALALLMTMKCSLMHLPFGGGKGGVQVNPRSMSYEELRRLTRRFTSALGQNIGPEYDIPAPDMGTNAQVMAWIADTYMNVAGRQHAVDGKAVVTGKPVEFGGSEGREKATGQGLLFVLERILPSMGMEMDGLPYTLAGFGNVGSWAGRLLQRKGAVLQAVLDHTGAIFSETGIDAEALANYVESNKSIEGFPGATPIANEAFYRVKADLFIPAALEQMVGVEQAQDLQCKVVAEAANAPVTPAGERILAERGIDTLPAILCNAGGVTVSYFEWQQSHQSTHWSLEEVDRKLKEMMFDAADRVVLMAKKLECPMSAAAYAAALEYIQGVYGLRGIFP